MPRRHLTYREIADDMAARIRSGEYQPGARLPSYQQLATLYSVSVSTAQRTYLLLEAAGLTYSEPGRGIFAEEPAGAAA